MENGNLVLSRKRGEKIMIGDDISVTVVDLSGEKVRLAVNAPKDMAVHREEVWHAIQRQKELK